MIKTEYLRVDPFQPEPDVIRKAAQYIQAGELVAFPTETVYGLGADAFQPAAVAKIYEAKGRPAQQALLVHISNRDQVRRLVSEVPEAARRLMDRFWPGPLSIILPALPNVPDIVRAGQPGVGLRMPAHPVALALIEMTGPLAAPSANLYGHPSPTSAEHVKHDMDGKIAAILDAGTTGAGMESTLLDLTIPGGRILRAGGIRVEEIEEFLGQAIARAGSQGKPGYSTGVQVILSSDQADFAKRRDKLLTAGKHLGVVLVDGNPQMDQTTACFCFDLRLDGSGMGLYAILRAAAEEGLEVLLVAPLDPLKAGTALMDRLQRAAAPAVE